MVSVDQEIADLENQISALRERLHILTQKRAEDTCPYKVKDIVVDDHGHRGVVIRVVPWYGLANGRPVVRLFNKSGELGMRVNNYYSWRATRGTFEGEICEP